MLRGLQIPVLPGPGGKARMIEDESEQLAKIIALSLSDCECDNPFTNVGISEDNVFDINDGAVRGRIHEYIERRFARFQREGRAKLKRIVTNLGRNDSGEAMIEIQYIDLKTRTPKDLRLGVGRFGTARVLEG